jgi:hypothetical protein
VRDRTLDEALGHFGFTEISNMFRIEVGEDGSDLSFPGWVPVADEGPHLTLTPDVLFVPPENLVWADQTLLSSNSEANWSRSAGWLFSAFQSILFIPRAVFVLFRIPHLRRSILLIALILTVILLSFN